MPPEILHSDYDKMYTTASDIYQFGMTAFEVCQILSLPDGRKASLSSVPLAQVPRYKLLDTLLKGQHPPQPASCSDEMYEIMKRCWYRERIRRPSIDEIIERIKTLIKSRRSKNDTVYKRTKCNSCTAEEKGSVYNPPQSDKVICHDFSDARMLKLHTFDETNQIKRSQRTSLGSSGRSGMMPTTRNNPDHETCNTVTYMYDNCPHGSRGENEEPKRLHENAHADLSSHISYENGSVDESHSLPSRHVSVEYVNDKFDDDHRNKVSNTLFRETRSRRTVVLSSGYSWSNEDHELCYDNNMSNNTLIQSVKNKIRKRSESKDFKTCIKVSSSSQKDSDRSEYIGNNEDNTHQKDNAKYQSGIHFMNKARNSIPLPIIPVQTHPFFIPDEDEKHATSASLSKSPKSQINQSSADESYSYRDFDLENTLAVDVFKNTGRNTSNVPIEGSVADQTVHVYDYAVFGEEDQARASDDGGYLEANTKRGQHQVHAANSQKNEKVDICFNDGYLESVTMRRQHLNNAAGMSKDRDVSFNLIQDRRSSHQMSDISAIKHIGHTLAEGTTLYEIKDISDINSLDDNLKGGACGKDKKSRSNIEKNGCRSQTWPKKVFSSSSHSVSDISFINTTGHTLGDGTTLYEIRDISDIHSLEDNANSGASEKNKDNRSNIEINGTIDHANTKKTFASSSPRVSDILVMNTTGHTLGEGTTLYAIRDITESIV
ncbi:hypothetical protein CHS0354_011024 [Potamilus streckersoni]|uniref:Protein kinase domain-containing protein n=1 Tax=Potamilus streckersoni TaxID=2493646 RepID=A0AAE0TKX2_9BIVA|nr:hypothetical protein CHS0354_011024 [Potamilus streckersoni]